MHPRHSFCVRFAAILAGLFSIVSSWCLEYTSGCMHMCNAEACCTLAKDRKGTDAWAGLSAPQDAAEATTCTKTGKLENPTDNRRWVFTPAAAAGQTTYPRTQTCSSTVSAETTETACDKLHLMTTMMCTWLTSLHSPVCWLPAPARPAASPFCLSGVCAPSTSSLTADHTVNSQTCAPGPSSSPRSRQRRARTYAASARKRATTVTVNETTRLRQ